MGWNYGWNVWFCWDFIDKLCAEIMGLNVYFVGMLLMDYVFKFMGSMCVFCWDIVDGFVRKIDG